MIDEATDVSNSEQVVIVLHWVDDSLSVHEDFIGLYKTDSTTAATLVALIKDVLLRCNISINMCRGQCYAVESPDCDRDLSISYVVKVLSELSCAQRVAFSQVFIVMNLLLVLPATNATSEWSFSALRRVKTYLRSTMTQLRLNNLLILHTYKDETDSLDLKAVVNEFVSVKESRSHFFGTF